MHGSAEACRQIHSGQVRERLQARAEIHTRPSLMNIQAILASGKDKLSLSRMWSTNPLPSMGLPVDRTTTEGEISNVDRNKRIRVEGNALERYDQYPERPAR